VVKPLEPKVPTLPLPPVPLPLHAAQSQENSENTKHENEEVQEVDHDMNAICRGYLSDLSSEDENVNWADDKDDSQDNSLDFNAASEPVNHPLSTRNIIPPPRPKRRKLDVPMRTV
jgi:hypothetical protein